MHSDKIYIGVDVGGTTINTGLVDCSGKILHSNTQSTDARRGSTAVIQSIINIIKALLAETGVPVTQVASIGIGVPGTADSKNGVVVFAPNIFWKDVQVSSLIRKAFNIPVFLGQDSRAAAWAEFLVGAGKGYRNIASVTLGTGIGCGMILNGKLFHGGLNTAGEFGHQIVELEGNVCNCGKRGCLEAHSAGLYIVREGRKIPNVEKLIDKDPDQLTVKDIYFLAGKDNAAARKITDSVVAYLGMGFVNLINLNSLELISISGGISNAPDDLLLNPLRKFIKERVYSAISDKVLLVKSSLGDNAPMIGAALLELSES